MDTYFVFVCYWELYMCYICAAYYEIKLTQQQSGGPSNKDSEPEFIPINAYHWPQLLERVYQSESIPAVFVVGVSALL